MIEKRASELPVLRRSHRERRANLIGMLGEELVKYWLSLEGFNSRVVGEIDHDMEIELGAGKLVHVDIKTKDRTVIPDPKHEATVPAYVYDKQEPDYYVFVSLLREKGEGDIVFKRAFVVGAISRSDFDKKKYFVEKGNKPNGANFFCDAWNINISSLDSPEAFLGSVKAHG